MRSNKGFTMIEMLLSMTFVAFLMITIALTTISITKTYQRGLILSQVNSAARAIMSDMQRTASQAPIQHNQTEVMHTSHAICFSNFSYVWNTGASLSSYSDTNPAALIHYSGSGPLNGKIVRLAKVNDPSRTMCASDPISSVPADQSTELLPSDSSSGTSYGGIAIQNTITAAQIASDSTQALYNVSFILGTNDQTALDKAQANKFATAPSCKPPTGADLSYCAVNKFDFLIRAGGGQYDSTN